MATVVQRTPSRRDELWSERDTQSNKLRSTHCFEEWPNWRWSVWRNRQLSRWIPHHHRQVRATRRPFNTPMSHTSEGRSQDKALENGGARSHYESVCANRLGFKHRVQPQIEQQAAHLPWSQESEQGDNASSLQNAHAGWDHPPARRIKSILQTWCPPRILVCVPGWPSSYMTTFNRPFGRYRFERLPFGLNLSQDVFQ